MVSHILASADAALHACFMTCFSATMLFHTAPAVARTNVPYPLDNGGQPGAIVSYVSARPGSVNLYELSKAKTPGRAPIILVAAAISSSAPDRALTRSTPSPEVGKQSVASSKGTGSMLAAVFGVITIRDNKGGTTEIRFEGAPPVDLYLTDVQDRLLPATWRDNILSLPSVAQFTLNGSSQAVDIARMQSAEYQLSASNLIGLEQVLDEGNATYLAFDEPKGGVSVLGGGHSISGTFRGRCYRLNGIARQLTVIVDGEVVYADRVTQVRSYERPSMVHL